MLKKKVVYLSQEDVKKKDDKKFGSHGKAIIQSAAVKKLSINIAFSFK